MTVETQKPKASLADPRLLEKIDKLFECNVGEYIALPQLVVVGDQSSGKSSVLETLTKLPFPREDTLCTRYATQIIFRRSPRISIAASVLPASDASEEHKKRAGTWKKQDVGALDAETFGPIMALANDFMEFKKGTTGIRSQFSLDVLRLEITGPDQEHLSIIDVPGLFTNAQEGLTTTADIELVKGMVEGYMKNPRSVMLAVVPANVDIATQGILQRAKEMDPEGIRTLGILTKPDLTPEGSERKVVDTVMGRSNKLKLGWHVLRNAGQKQLKDSIETRHEKERAFFAREPYWKEIDKSRVGVDALRTRLGDVLASHVRREFPQVKSEINKRLALCKKALEDIGSKRQSTADQSRYLTSVFSLFSRNTQEALNCNYGRSNIFKDNQNLRLVTEAVNRSEAMSTTMAQYGHMYNYKPSNSQIAHEDPFSNGTPRSVDESPTISVSTQVPQPAVEDLVPELHDIYEPQDGQVLEWIKIIYRQSRGFELGTFNSTLLATIMKEQASKWQYIALGYITDIIIVTHRYIVEMLEQVCPIQRVREGVMFLLSDDLSKKYQGAINHTHFLLEVELNGVPATLNHYFNDNLQKSRIEQMSKAMQALSYKDGAGNNVIKVKDLDHHHNNMSNIDHTVQEIHDILEAYYKVALKRFVDCLRMQAADHFLISGPESPLSLFSPNFVAGLTPEQLEEAAGEDSQVKSQRAMLEKEEQDLEEAKKIVR